MGFINIHSKRVQNTGIFFSWQVVTLFLSGTMICSNYLAQNATSLPTLQSFPPYFLIAIIFTPLYLFKFGWKNPTLRQPLKYPLMIFLDLEGNFCLIQAFNYTSLTSVSLLNCSTAIFVALWSRLFLKYRFRLLHILFIFLSLCGLVILVVSDVYFGDGSFLVEGKAWYHVVLGDFLVVFGCFLYSIANVVHESVIRDEVPLVEDLAFFGLCGTVLSLAQGMVVDIEALAAAVSEGRRAAVWASFFLFGLFLLLVYVTMAYLFIVSSAIAMNLSFLLADFWAILFEWVVMGKSFHWMRYLAFAVAIMGMVGFNVSCHVYDPKRDEDVVK